MTIYGDILVIINFIINLILLKVTTRLLSLRVRPSRLYIGAFLSALCSLFVVLGISSVIFNMCLRLLVTAVGVGISFWGLGKRSVIKAALTYYLVASVLAGVMGGLIGVFPKLKSYYINGMLYFNIPPFVFVIGVTICYIFVTILEKLLFARAGAKIHSVKLVRDKKVCYGKVMLDTGNSLVESFSGLPVAVATYEAMYSLLTENEREFFCCRDKINAPKTLRPIVYTLADGKGGIMYGIRLDSFLVEGYPEKICYLAIKPDGGDFAEGVNIIAGSRLF